MIGIAEVHVGGLDKERLDIGGGEEEVDDRGESGIGAVGRSNFTVGRGCRVKAPGPAWNVIRRYVLLVVLLFRLLECLGVESGRALVPIAAYDYVVSLRILLGEVAFQRLHLRGFELSRIVSGIVRVHHDQLLSSGRRETLCQVAAIEVVDPLGPGVAPGHVETGGFRSLIA